MNDAPDEAKERQERSKLDILRIADLIANMDKYFRFKRCGYDFQQIELNNAINIVIKNVNEKYEHRIIKISHNLKTKKYYIKGNELINDVFSNIIENSLMYDKREEIDIKITITDSQEYDDYWQIEFLFESPLIQQEMNKILTKSTQNRESISGSGFGLILVSAIVESMNGFIQVKKVDKGSAIFVDVPKFYE